MNKNVFNRRELSGSFGDMGLFIPLAVAMTISADLDIGTILIFAGIMNILTGLIFKQPIPIQPMKALAIVVISENMVRDELAAAGILMGIALVVLSFFIDKIDRYIPRSIVRGIQLGVGLKLILKALSWLQNMPVWAPDSMLTAALVVVILFLCMRLNIPGLLYVFLFGFLLMYWIDPSVYSGFQWSLPEFSWSIPGLWAFKHGLVTGVLPQLPLTLLNSVIAVCALSADYFPGRGIPPRRMALSVGLMNLFAVPFGAIPMCHGSSGLAAHYRFGARTGGSVILLGCLKILAGLIFGSVLFTLLQNYPASILAPMLVFAGLELARQAQDAFGNKSSILMVLVTAVGIVAVNTFIGFILGYGLYLSLAFFRKFKT